MIEITYHGQTAEINVYSDLNDWIDYTFIVPAEHGLNAANALENAYIEWFDSDPCETLFEALQTSIAPFIM